MTNSNYSVKVPGKLFIAGEYAVLEPGQKAVVVAVDRYITINIESSNENLLSTTQEGLEDILWEIKDDKVKFNIEDSRLEFIQNSLTVVNQFLREKSVVLRPFKLKIESDLEDPFTGKKYGLGSSAAIVVGVISAILYFHGFKEGTLSLEDIFKLSAIAHIKTQKNGSGADIAAAIYGGWIQYSAFGSQWVLKELEKGKGISQLVNTSWPNLSIKSLTPPSALKLVVGWTREPASTGPMVKKVEGFREENLEDYKEFIRESSIAVEGLIESFNNDNYTEAINSLTKCRKALQLLQEKVGISIETEKLKTLSSIANKYGSGKSSGAGGGDCGIAFIESDSDVQGLYREWKEAGISPLDLSF